MKVVATTRVKQGTSASRRLRRANQVPGIVYGGAVATNISMEHNPLYHSMRVESFHSTILDMEIDGKSERVLLRDAQWHPYKPQILHVDFQRITNDTVITMKVPVHFTGEEVSPAVKTGGAIVSHITTELLVRCLAVNLPEFITVDLSTAELGHAVRVSSITLPEGVKIANRKEDPVLATFVVPGEEEVTPTSAPAAPAAAPATKGAAAKLAAAGAAAPAAGKAPAKAPAKK